MAAITGHNATVSIGDQEVARIIDYRFTAQRDGSLVLEGAEEVPRNPKADRNTSPDAKRRMAYRAARRMLQNGQISPGMSDVEIEMIAVDIAIECNCSEYVAQQAVRTMTERNLVYRAAVRMLQAGDIDAEMPPLRRAGAEMQIMVEMGCDLEVARRAIDAALRHRLRDDAPAMPQVSEYGVSPISAADEDMQRIRDRWRLRSLVWPTGSGLPAAQPNVPAKPVQPQSFERPKRRIVLE